MRSEYEFLGELLDHLGSGTGIVESRIVTDFLPDIPPDDYIAARHSLVERDQSSRTILDRIASDFAQSQEVPRMTSLEAWLFGQRCLCADSFCLSLLARGRDGAFVAGFQTDDVRKALEWLLVDLWVAQGELWLSRKALEVCLELPFAL